MSDVFKISATGNMMRARGIFRRRLGETYSSIKLAGLPDEEPILLRKIYVPLLLTQGSVFEEVDEAEIHQGAERLETWCSQLFRKAEHDESDSIHVLEHLGRNALNLRQPHRALLISGEAGSGKSTLTRSIVASLCGTAPDSFNRYFEPWLPIPILLRETPVRLLNDLDGLVHWWLERLGRPSSSRDQDSLDLQQLKLFLDRGHAFLLFDGLDELGTVQRRRQFLETLKGHRWIDGEHPNFVFVTGRPTGYADLGKTLDEMPGLRLNVAPFSKPQIEDYLTRWFKLRPTRVSGEQASPVEVLMERLTQGDQKLRLLAMARRPAYLAALAFVHGTRGQLPHTRAELYELLVDAYLEILDQQRGLVQQTKDGDSPEAAQQPMNWERSDKIQVLSALAFTAHFHATGPEGQAPEDRDPEDRRFSWSRQELVDAVRAVIEPGAGRLRTLKPEHAEDLTAYFIARTGLLAETREGVFQFFHLSFQEYLAALFVLDLASAAPNKAEFLEKRLLNDLLQRDGWQEVAILLLAVDGGRSRNSGHRQVLARLRLDREHKHHFELLTRVLAGHEVRLTTDERYAWLLVWYAAAAAWRWTESAQQIGRLEDNLPLLQEAWQRLCHGLAKEGFGWAGGTWKEALNGLQEHDEPESSTETTASPSSWLAIDRSDGHWAEPAQRTFETLISSLKRSDAAARAILLPAEARYRPDKLALHLKPILHKLGHGLFATQGQAAIRKPTALWWAVEGWSWSDVALSQALLDHTPPSFALTHLAFTDRALFEFGGAGLRQRPWLREVISLAWGAEQIWCARELQLSLHSKKFFRDVSREKISWGKRERALDLALDLDLALARALDLALDLARDLARARALARDLARALDLARARDLARALDLARDLALARALDLALDDKLQAELLEAVELLIKVGLEEKKPKNIQETSLLLLSWLFTALANGGMLNNGVTRVQRGQVSDALHSLSSAEAMTGPLQDPEMKKRAELDWRELQPDVCEWSPIPLLEALLKDESWAEIDVSPRAIIDSFAARVRELAEHVDDGS